jgi:pyrroloquinoline quinone (PQQ) biosynthesis protein C
MTQGVMSTTGELSQKPWDGIVARIDALSHPAGKDKFVQAIMSTNGDVRMLRAFAEQYHFFSVMQASLIPVLIQCFKPTDIRALAELSDILADEYGKGKADEVHSEIFKRFAVSVGVDPNRLPISESEVVAGIRAYLDGIREAYLSKDLPRVLAVYSFLERSAVHSYGPLLRAFREVGMDERAIEFFPLHVEIEPEHAETAINFSRSRLLAPAELERFKTEIEAFGSRWASFWSDLDNVASRACH